MKKSKLNIWIISILSCVFSVCLLFGCSGGPDDSQGEDSPSDKVEILLDKTELTMNVGDKASLKATVSDESVEIVWKSENPQIVDVYKGNLNALMAGVSTVTAEITVGGVSSKATCVVTVEDYYKLESSDTLRVYRGDEVDISLNDQGIKNFSYSVTLKNGENQIDNCITDNVLMFKETDASGNYVLIYSITGDGIADTIIEREVELLDSAEYGMVNAITSVEDVQIESSPEVIMTNNFPVFEKGNKTEILRANYSDHLRFTMKQNLAPDIKLMNDNDYIELTYYIQEPSVSFAYYHSGYLDFMTKIEKGNDSIIKRYSLVKYKVNEWDTIRVYGREIKPFINDEPEIYVRYHLGNEKANLDGTEKAIECAYLYDFRIILGDITAEKTDSIDIAIPEYSINNLKYNFSVKNQDGQEVLSGNREKTVLDQLTNGKYMVEYSIENNCILNKNITRNLIIEDKNEKRVDINPDDIFSMYNGLNKYAPTTGGVAFSDEKLPDNGDEKSIKISKNDSFLNNADGAFIRPKGMQIDFTIRNINLKEITDNPLNKDKLLQLQIYYDDPAVNAGTTNNWSMYTFCDSVDCWQYLNGKYVYMTNGEIKANEWSTISIAINDLKLIIDEIYESKKGQDALSYISLGFMVDKLNGNPNNNVYISSHLDIVEPAYAEYGVISDFGGADKIAVWGHNWNTFPYGPVVVRGDDLPAGQPGEKDNALVVGLQKNTILYVDKEFNFAKDINSYSDNDYVSLRYFISSEGTKEVHKRGVIIDITNIQTAGNANNLLRVQNVMLTVNQWAEQRFYLRDFKQVVGDNTKLYFRIHFGEEAIKEYGMKGIYLYDMRFVPGDINVKPQTEFNASVYTNDMDVPYTFAIYNESHEEIATGNDKNTMVKGLEAGKYTIEYKFTKKIFKEDGLTRKLNVEDNYISAVTDDGAVDCVTNAKAGMVNQVVTVEQVSQVPEGAPQNTEFVKLVGNKEITNHQNYPMYFKYTSDLSDIINDPANENKSFEFYVYYDQPNETNTGTNAWNYLILYNGMDNSLNVGGQLYSKYGAENVAIYANKWSKITIKVSELKNALNGKTYGSVNLGLLVSCISSDNFQYDMYISSLKLV